jgi:predicted O-linked N-acetylglucosamine transferase (SPINDLY family)
MLNSDSALAPRRNSVCVCGSGRKYKHCCGSTAPVAHASRAARSGQQWYEEGNRSVNHGGVDEAVSCYRAAVAAQPNLYQAHGNLGVLLEGKGQLHDSLMAYHAALVHGVGTADAAAILGNYRSCLAHYQTWLLELHRSESVTPDGIAAEHRRFAQLIENNHAAPRLPHTNIVDPERRLRIGYVSPDFRYHSVAYFAEPLIEHHDRDVVNVFCYYTGPPGDAVTQRFQVRADHWRSATRWTDDELAECVRTDAIDILVDLAGHTVGNRLLAFARKPAPVLIAYLGYPGSTALSTMDYRITDDIPDPDPAERGGSTERLLRLARPMLAYRPGFGPNGLLDETPLAVAPAPVARNGFVTFGCFNAAAKIGASAIDAWARVLDAVPHSKLLLKSRDFDDARGQADWRERLSGRGIGIERLQLLGRDEDHAAHLRRYGDIDISLDTFPYNGVTTTCDSLWMGVPVITLAGSTAVSRMGLSIVSRLGCCDWAALDTADYVAKAAQLAGDVARLVEIRLKLRDRLEASPLMDGIDLARSVEAAYRSAWHAWCAAQLTGSPVLGASGQRPR